MTDKSYDDIRAILRTLENNNNQRVQANERYRKDNGKLRDQIASLNDDAFKWRRLMELVDGNGAWTAIDVVSHLSQEPKNETARRGVRASGEIKIQAGDVVDEYLVKTGELVTEGHRVYNAQNWDSSSSYSEAYLVERNGVKVQPGMAQWEWDIINEVVPPKPELPTEPGAIFRVLEFDGEPFEVVACLDVYGDCIALTEGKWPSGSQWLLRGDKDSITKFELLEVVPKESA